MPPGPKPCSQSPAPGFTQCSPNRELHQVIDLVTPNETTEGEALQLHNEHIGQPPQQQLFGGLTMLFALWTVPGRDRRVRTTSFPPACPTTSLLPHPHQASSGASTSGRVKRLRHWSRVKWPARAASPAEPGSSAHSSSLEATNTNSWRRSLFRHTRARLQSSPRSNGVSPGDEQRQWSPSHAEQPAQATPQFPPTPSDTFVLKPLLSV